MFAVAPPEGFTDGGLIVQTGRIAPAVCEVTRQLRSTVPLKPLRAETAIFEAASWPGATANGLKSPNVMVKS